MGDGVDGQSIATVEASLLGVGAKVHLIAPRLGMVKPRNGEPFDATGTFENSPSVLLHDVVLPDGIQGVKALGASIEVTDFISNQYRHGKTILAIGMAKALLDRAGVADPGIVMETATKTGHAVVEFITALGRHRHPEREVN